MGIFTEKLRQGIHEVVHMCLKSIAQRVLPASGVRMKVYVKIKVFDTHYLIV